MRNALVSAIFIAFDIKMNTLIFKPFNSLENISYQDLFKYLGMLET